MDGATSYDVQITDKPTFAVSFFDRTGITDTSVFVADLKFGETYRWRVRGVNDSLKGEWAEASFTTMSSGGMSPSLLSPSDNARNVPTSSTLRWSRVQGALSYSVQVARDVNFRNIVLDASDVVDTVLVLQGLAWRTRYYWRVQAVFSSGAGAWSGRSSFTTVSLFSGPPGLLAPPRQATQVHTPVRLQWRGIEGAETYIAQIATDEVFESLVVDAVGIAATSLQLFELQSNTEYFWRVRGVGDNDTSDWSEVWRFKTGTLTSVETVEEVPARTFELAQNYPNPFNPVTTIEFSLPVSSRVHVVVFNSLGQKVTTLVDREMSAGRHRAQWSAISVESGVYYYRIQAGSFVQTRRAVLLK